MKYNDKFDADLQVILEERIAALIYDGAETEDESRVLVQSAQDLGRDILQMVVAELRPDLVARKWRISDGNASETYEDWDELVSAVEKWYSYISEGNWPENVGFPTIFLGLTEEGDVEVLNRSIRILEEKIAQAAGYKPFYGHGNYAVSAASEMGLNLTVREEDTE